MPGGAAFIAALVAEGGSFGAAILGASLSGMMFSLKIALILVPALILYELLAPLPVFERCGRALGPWLSRLGMSPPCAVPLVAGLFLGIIYGAGIIIPIAEEKKIGPEELHSLGLFLCTCHAIIEDTLLFALAGAAGPGEVAGRMLLLAGLRLLLALTVLGGRQALLRRRGKKPSLALD